MAHLSGLLLIDCPASALNNAGADPEVRDRNAVAVKKIKTKNGYFPYVSAQAFRYWLRDTLTQVEGWNPSPVYREEDIAYTDANPIDYAEDDIFGYMRAPGGSGDGAVKSKRTLWKEKHLTDQETAKDGSGKEKFVTLTRSSPFRVSTLVSISSSDPVSDFGVMARQDDFPVIHQHEFYRTALVGLFSIDLRMLGRFYHISRTGYKHLDSVRRKLAEERKLETYDEGKAYQLSLEERKVRLKQLLRGLAQIAGGAKLALHYTDVTPRLLMLAVANGGNHLFGTAVTAVDRTGLPKINDQALTQVAKVYKASLLSDFHIGLAHGYMDDQRATLSGALKAIRGLPESATIEVPHPVEAIDNLLAELEPRAAEWLA
jgi:CRISPR-associated protein Cst2